MKEKLLLRAIRGETIPRPPIWVMRQAGRYLPEYHETKERAGGFLGLCRKPEYGIEVTLQPIQRFGFDAAILFSDILTPLPPMGIELTFNPGPIIGNPVRTIADVNALTIPDVERSLHYVFEIIGGLKESLPEETALIGFAGAPFTVASYMVPKESEKGLSSAIRAMLYGESSPIPSLLAKLEAVTAAYLKAQVDAGAEVIQLFDSSAWQLPGHLIGPLALEPAKRVIKQLKKQLEPMGIPIIYFAPGAMASLNEMSTIGADVIGIDWRCSLSDAKSRLGDRHPIQGNLDPAVLLADKQVVVQETTRVIHEIQGRPGHIFNLGHGILPNTPIKNVETLVQTVKESAS